VSPQSPFRRSGQYQICSDWLDARWNELSETGPAGIDLPPIYKLRLARASEREAYEVGGTGFEFCGAVKVVNLIDVVDQVQPEAEHPSGHLSEHNDTDDEKSHGHDNAG
jgi:hypothetical protein